MKRVIIPTTEQPPRYVVTADGELPLVPEGKERTDEDRATFLLGRHIIGRHFKVNFFRNHHYHMHPISADTPLFNDHRLADQLPQDA